jgi:hypothetical protein
MSSVKELKAQLDAKQIAYPTRATKPDLEALLASSGDAPAATPAAPTASGSVAANLAPHVDAVDAKKGPTDLSGIAVGDPLELRPVELPLVIKPKSGAWANKQQARYAGMLNAYAYKNADKFKAKKKTLLGRLVEIGNDPSAFDRYAGPKSGLSFNDKRFAQGNDEQAAAE